MEFIRTAEEVTVAFCTIPMALIIQVKVFERCSNSLTLYNNIANSTCSLTVLIYNLYGVLVAFGRNNVGFYLLTLAVVPRYGVRFGSTGYSCCKISWLSCFYRNVFCSNYRLWYWCWLHNLEWLGSLNLALATTCTFVNNVCNIGFVLCQVLDSLYNFSVFADRNADTVFLNFFYCWSSVSFFLHKDISLTVFVSLYFHVSRVVGNVHNFRITLYRLRYYNFFREFVSTHSWVVGIALLVVDVLCSIIEQYGIYQMANFFWLKHFCVQEFNFFVVAVCFVRNGFPIVKGRILGSCLYGKRFARCIEIILQELNGIR